MKRSVILYFGSFNPVHKGHIFIADTALDMLRADELWLVVSPQNPFKESCELAPEKDRLRMTDIAIASARNSERMKSCDVEFEMDKPSRTVDTLKVLSRKYPSYDFTLLIGSDNVDDFDKWKEYEYILDNYTVAVYPREGCIPKNSELAGRFVHLKNVPLHLVASTGIRELINGGKGEKWLPDGVSEYIKEKGLYVSGK